MKKLIDAAAIILAAISFVVVAFSGEGLSYWSSLVILGALSLSSVSHFMVSRYLSKEAC